MTRWSIGSAVRSGLAALAIGVGATGVSAQEPERPFLCETPDGIEAMRQASDCYDIEGVVFPEDTVWAGDAYQVLDGRESFLGQIQQPAQDVRSLHDVGYRLLRNGAEIPIRARDPQGNFLGNARIDIGEGQRIEIHRDDQRLMQLAGWRETGDGTYQFNPSEALLVSETGRETGQAAVRFHVVSEDHPSTRVGGCFVVGTPRQLSGGGKNEEVAYAPDLECATPITEYGTPPPAPLPVVPVTPPPAPAPEPEGPYSFIGAGPAFKFDHFRVDSNFTPDVCWDGDGLALTAAGQLKRDGVAVTGSGLYADLSGECQGGVEKEATVMEGYVNLVVGDGFGIGATAEGVDFDLEGDRGLSVGLIGVGPSWRSGDFAVSAGPAYVFGEDDEYDWSGIGAQAFATYMAADPEHGLFTLQGLRERLSASAGVHYYDVGDTEGVGGRGQAALRLAEIGPVGLSALGGFTIEALCHDEGNDRYLNDRWDGNENLYFGLRADIGF